MKFWERLFTNKADQRVNAIMADSEKKMKDTAIEAQELVKLLKKNGISLQIMVAMGVGRKR